MAEPWRGLRVLMTTDTLGGVWDYSLELAGQLARQEVRTVLATLGRLPTAAQSRAAAAVPGLLLETSAYRLEWMPDAGSDPERAGDWLLQLERRHAPDIVHLNNYLLPPHPWRAPCLVVAHSCVLSWWQAVKKEPAPRRQWQPYAARVRQSLQRAETVVTPTAALLRTLVELYGPLRRAEVIRNGRRPDPYRPAGKGNYVFSAGRLWDEAKNLRTLASVAPELDWLVMAAGEWRRPEGGEERPANVEYLGQLEPDEMAWWLAAAPIYALPARYEPFGLSVLEAALSGCALVLGDIPTLRELWDEAALFVPPDDSCQLKSVLQGLIRDLPLRQGLARAARQRARRYGAERMAGSYGRLYAGLLAERAASTAAVSRRPLQPTLTLEKG